MLTRRPSVSPYIYIHIHIIANPFFGRVSAVRVVRNVYYKITAGRQPSRAADDIFIVNRLFFFFFLLFYERVIGFTMAPVRYLFIFFSNLLFITVRFSCERARWCR